MAKSFSKKFYDSKEWKQVRESVLMRDGYLCVLCGKPAEEVHHIIHLDEQNINDPMVSSGMDNLVSLCWLCHKRIHAMDNSKNAGILKELAFDDDGNPIVIG